ncbi:MAG: nucleotidyltransferase [Terrimicrobiaceae bacterium]|nr:nucleotidyltransferase [Terrimicrobiaceae bacterium]
MSFPRIVEAALELQAAIREIGLGFCFIGGLAIQRWSEPRFTQDADASVLTRIVDDERLVDGLLKTFEGRRSDARPFALKNRVLLLKASNGVNLDVSMGVFDFEARCIERATDWKIGGGAVVRTCTVEDLVVHKAFAARDLDWIDVENMMMRHGRNLNVRQIFEELRPLVELKEDASILPRLEGLMRKRDVID